MKKTKLIASLLTCVMCLSFLAVGVWAAVVSVNFNLNGNLQFYPEGVYVELSGQVYRGSSEETLEALTYDSRFTLEPITNYDNSTGEPSGNFPMESWEIGSIPFIPTEKVVKIEVTVVNHSEIAIIGTPSILVDENQEISTITNLSVTENDLDVLYMEAGDTAIYELILEVTDSAEINNTLSVSFDFSAPEVNYSYFTINSSNQITGLTQAYIEDKPKVLVVPGYTQDGQNSLSFASATGGSSGYVYTLANIASTAVIIQEGFSSIGVMVFPSGNNVKIISLPSTLTRINYYSNFSSMKKINFAHKNGVVSTGSGFNYEYSIDELSNPYSAAEACRSYLASYGMSKTA